MRELSEAWGLRYDSDGDDLAALSENELLATRMQERADVEDGEVQSIGALVDAGRLSPGALLRWERPNLGVVYEATVSAEGRLRLADGREFDTPSRAAKEAAGIEHVNGWRVWRTASGKTLSDLWRENLVTGPTDDGRIPEWN